MIHFQRLRGLLETKTAAFLCIAVAIGGRIIQAIFFHGALFDVTLQTTAAKSLLHGHGIALSSVNSTDLANLAHQPLLNWPPGYPVLLAPFLAFTHADVHVAGILLDIAAATALIFTSRALAKTLGASRLIVSLFTICSGYFLYYFYYIGSVDAIGIAFFLAAILVATRFLYQPKNMTRAIITASVLLFLAASMKYLFYPVIFLVPVSLFLYGIATRIDSVRKVGAWIFLFSLLGIAVLVTWQRMHGGGTGYISQPERGFFPGHLKDAYPFIPASFFSETLVARLAPGKTSLIMNAFRIIHVILLAVFSIMAISRFLRNRWKSLEPYGWFLHLSLFISLSVSAVLIFLSLRVQREEITPGNFWTYVGDPRYYGICQVLLHVIAVTLMFHIRSSSGWKSLAWILPLLLLPETFRGMAFTANRCVHFSSQSSYWQKEKNFQQYADTVIRHAREVYHTDRVVVTGTSFYVSSNVRLYSDVPLLDDPQALSVENSLHTSMPVVLLVIVAPGDVVHIPLLTSTTAKLAGEFHGLYFYTVYVEPD